ncbi:MAG: hypothetical protein EOO90_15080 [Pedobacter sp.]|nr:MAG: hypothetical protein EOO90_15080 [Pedobacter sp.]
MKKLSNVSPFILLLVPVLMMFALAFTSAKIEASQNEEVALETNPTKTGLVIKATTAIFK